MVAKRSGKSHTYILWFKEIGINDVDLVGGKNASLGEMYNKLTKKGIRVPNGFAVTAQAYWHFLQDAGLEKKIKQLVAGLDPQDIPTLRSVGKKVRSLIMAASFSDELTKEITAAYHKLSSQTKQKKLAVAVRSSATAEDLPDASFAGQQETYLNIRGEKALLLSVKKCIASLFTDRAMSYRHEQGYGHMNVALSVTVQQMIHADTGASGVMFTMDTASGFPGVVLINSSYGLGEYVVKGRITPDQYYVFKDGIAKGKPSIISKTLGTKEVKLVYGKSGGTKQAKVPRTNRDRFAISDKDVVQLAKWGMMIEKHYKRPQDIEWAKDGKTGNIYIVQARPETVKSHINHAVIETYKLKKTGRVLLRGTAVGQKIGAGPARIIEKPSQMRSFKKGDILVTRITDPDWEPIMRMASAIVTEQGGKTSHAAIVARELGIPAIVGVPKARSVLKQGQKVTVSCAKGDEGLIYRGILPFEVQRTELKKIPKTKTKVMMNVGDPEHAFALSFLPHDGVGLARLEFIFNEFIRIHPLALVNYKTLKDAKAKKKIRELTRGYSNKADFCVDKLAEGVGRIAAAMYPKPVIVRLSDFKSNEYATLIGGEAFEPEEQNPMLGWRGASRYYSKEYKAAFKLECKAIAKVRDTWGLDNVIPMVPFCRTPEEGKKVLSTMAQFGLKQGVNGLEVYVMCEIPSNVILAEEFAKIFDGFSIGSNDLTQLALGVDRDSAEVSHIYDERNKAVTDLLKNVIRVAKKHKKHIGICGQAPSDYPEFTEMLVRERIDNISLNPDTVVATRQRIAKVEKTLGNTGAKTNKKYLSLVASFGILAASIMGIGAGCTETIIRQPVGVVEDIAPAEIREKVMHSIQQQLDDIKEQIEQKTTQVEQSSLAQIRFTYPADWTNHHWEDGILVKDQVTGDYASVFKQVRTHPVADEEKEPLLVGGYAATRYTIAHPQNSRPLHIVEIVIDDDVVEINGQTDDFDTILASITFGDIGAKAPLGTACIQVITYARASAEGVCQVFPTPCDVPDDWQVCDGDDIQ